MQQALLVCQGVEPNPGPQSAAFAAALDEVWDMVAASRTCVLLEQPFKVDGHPTPVCESIQAHTCLCADCMLVRATTHGRGWHRHMDPLTWYSPKATASPLDHEYYRSAAKVRHWGPLRDHHAALHWVGQGLLGCWKQQLLRNYGVEQFDNQYSLPEMVQRRLVDLWLAMEPEQRLEVMKGLRIMWGKLNVPMVALTYESMRERVEQLKEGMQRLGVRDVPRLAGHLSSLILSMMDVHKLEYRAGMHFLLSMSAYTDIKQLRADQPGLRDDTIECFLRTRVNRRQPEMPIQEPNLSVFNNVHEITWRHIMKGLHHHPYHAVIHGRHMQDRMWHHMWDFR